MHKIFREISILFYAVNLLTIITFKCLSEQLNIEVRDEVRQSQRQKKKISTSLKMTKQEEIHDVHWKIKLTKYIHVNAHTSEREAFLWSWSFCKVLCDKENFTFVFFAALSCAQRQMNWNESYDSTNKWDVKTIDMEETCNGKDWKFAMMICRYFKLPHYANRRVKSHDIFHCVATRIS